MMLRSASKRCLTQTPRLPHQKQLPLRLPRPLQAQVSPQHQNQLLQQSVRLASSFAPSQRRAPQGRAFLLGRQLIPALNTLTSETKRGFYMWVENLFNAVDNSRFSEVGPNRAGSEFVFRMGGKIRLEGSELWLEKESELPSGSFTVEAVDLKGISLTDRGLENLKELPSLRELDISQTLLTGSSFKVLSLFSSLKVLKMTGLTQAKKDEVQAGIALLANKIPRCRVIAA